jgi:hypothetical protein
MKERLCCLAIFLFLVALAPDKSQALSSCVDRYDENLNGDCLTSSCSTGCNGSGGGFGVLLSAAPSLPDRIEVFSHLRVRGFTSEDQRHPKVLSNGDADFNLFRPTSRLHLRSCRAYIEAVQQRKGV